MKRLKGAVRSSVGSELLKISVRGRRQSQPPRVGIGDVILVSETSGELANIARMTELSEMSRRHSHLLQVAVMEGSGFNVEVSLKRCSRWAKFQLVWAS